MCHLLIWIYECKLTKLNWRSALYYGRTLYWSIFQPEPGHCHEGPDPGAYHRMQTPCNAMHRQVLKRGRFMVFFAKWGWGAPVSSPQLQVLLMLPSIVGKLINFCMIIGCRKGPFTTSRGGQCRHIQWVIQRWHLAKLRVFGVWDKTRIGRAKPHRHTQTRTHSGLQSRRVFCKTTTAIWGICSGVFDLEMQIFT